MVSKIPSVRALDELRDNYKRMIEEEFKDNVKAAKEAIATAKDDADKEAVKKVVAAIEALDIPYTLVHKSLCNIRSYSGNLTITLNFNSAGSTKLKRSVDVISKADLQQNKQMKRLQDWHRDSLYRIANRKEIDIFEVHP